MMPEAGIPPLWESCEFDCPWMSSRRRPPKQSAGQFFAQSSKLQLEQCIRQGRGVKTGLGEKFIELLWLR